MQIAVVVPTNRPEGYAAFLKRWQEQFYQHEVALVTVWDGDKPYIEYLGSKTPAKDLEGHELVANHCAGVRNLGFLYVAQRLKEIEIIVTLDDDMTPDGDTIGDHVRILQKKLPISWFSHTGEAYMRGFPYAVRNEAPVMLSHGVWQKNPDWDAPTQLLNDNAPHKDFYKGAIPKGSYFNFCGMNVAFKREALPYVYYAPVSDFKGAERFDDIWAGIPMKEDFDKNGWAVATGYASCIHERASNVFNNLIHEAVGIKYNEDFWQGKADHKWFKSFKAKRQKWHNILKNKEILI
jgi:hypothetical protein